MAHYSEMDFLFNNESPTKEIVNTSNGNIFNIFKDPKNDKRPGYVVFKNKNQYLGTDGIKTYLQDTIYKKRNKNNNSTTNPYIDLLNEFNIRNGNYGAGLRLKPSDFSYLKDLGVYPINRMVILRRFPEGGFVPEDLLEMRIEPISTIIGWIKPDQNFGSVTFSENWEKTTERFDVALKEVIKKTMGNAVDISKIVPTYNFGQGILFEFYKRMDLLDRTNADDSLDENYEYFDTNLGDEGRKTQPTDTSNTWGLNNIPVGDANLLQEAPFRNPEGQNIKSDFSFDVETTYEQKLIGDVDPGSAMLDILDNIYAMGTSNMVFYWGDDSPTIKNAKQATAEKANDINAWWDFIKEITSKFWEVISDFFSNIVSKAEAKYKDMIDTAKNTAQEEKQNSAELENRKKEHIRKRNIAEGNIKKYKVGTKEHKIWTDSYNYNSNELKKLEDVENSNKENSDYLNKTSGIANGIDKIVDTLISTLKTILTSTIAIHRFRLRGSIELMVGGKDSSAPWHITIGNPFAPWINTSHIIIKSATVESSNEMGFNDMPMRLTVKFNCQFSRSLGKQELMRMFNNTYRRTYSKQPKKAEQFFNFNPLNIQNNNEINTTTTPNVEVVSNNSITPGTNNNNTESSDPSIVNYLQTKNQDSSYKARKKLANEYGISEYRGTADQNIQLLNILKNNAKIK